VRVRVEGEPGELQQRAEDVIKVIRRLAGHQDCDHLEKAAADQVPRKLDLPALQGGVDRASKTVDKIRRRMLAKMLEVVKED
jgi:hypothetical protein